MTSGKVGIFYFILGDSSNSEKFIPLEHWTNVFI